MRLLLFSDLHLDTAFGWAGPELGDVLRANLRTTLDRIVALAGQVDAEALLCAGDLLDQGRCGPATLAHLRSAFDRVEIPVYVAPGDLVRNSHTDTQHLQEPASGVQPHGDGHLFTIEPAGAREIVTSPVPLGIG